MAQEELRSQLPEVVMPELAEMIAMAMSGSDDMAARELAEIEARGRRIAGRSSVLPSFAGSFNYRQEEDQSEFSRGFEERLIYQFAISQPLYHWGARHAEKEIGRLSYDMELLNTQSYQDRVVSTVRSQYMDLLVARQDIELTRQEMALLRREIESQRQRHEAGRASPAELFNLELELERLELAEARSLAARDEKLMELARFLGKEPSAIEEKIAGEVPEIEVLTPDQTRGLTAYFDQGLAANESLQRKELEIEVDEKRLLIEKTSLRPKVDLQVGLSQNALDADGVRREQEFVYAGFRVNWAIFDGWRSKGRRMEARARLDRNELSKEVLENSLLRDQSRALANLELAGRALQIEEKLLANRRGGFGKADEDLEAQRISEIQYEELKQAFYRQSIRTQQYRAAYLEALGDLSLLLGMDPQALEAAATGRQ